MVKPFHPTRKGIEESLKRKDQLENNDDKLGDLSTHIPDIKLQAEYDTWVWYYKELSAIRNECSRLGLLVRMNTKESAAYAPIYNAHIMSLLLMISSVLPETTWQLVEAEWTRIDNEIIEHQKKLSMAPTKPLETAVIRDLDKLYRFALKIAQRVGLGFKTTLTEQDGTALTKAFLGE